MDKPVQVFILMGQSNMLGFGKVAGDKAGTLEGAVKEGTYPFLVDDDLSVGRWRSYYLESEAIFVEECSWFGVLVEHVPNQTLQRTLDRFF